jgi:hypothetical protein
MQRHVWLLAVALALSGCRALPFDFAPPLPAEHEVPIEQLVFHSDFDLPQGHRLVRELTAERDDIATTLGLPPSDERIDVYLFRDAEAYGQYLARYFPSVPSRRAFFVETDTRLAVYAHWSDRVAEDLRHEVAHGYLHASVPALPLWLDEGLAEYFEVPRGNGGLNRPHVELLADMIDHEKWRPDIERLERLSTASEMQQIDYAESWAWVYFLLQSTPERRKLLAGYLAEMREHGAVGPLSTRVAALHIQPRQTLTEYLVALNAETRVVRASE